MDLILESPMELNDLNNYEKNIFLFYITNTF